MPVERQSLCYRMNYYVNVGFPYVRGSRFAEKFMLLSLSFQQIGTSGVSTTVQVRVPVPFIA